MSGFNLLYLQFHFSESKGSDKGTATLHVILLNYEELPGDVKSNTCLGVLLPILTLSREIEVGSRRLRWFKKEGKPMNKKITQHSHQRSLHNKGHDTKKTCKHRARGAKAKTRWGQRKHLKLRRKLSLEQEEDIHGACPPLRELPSRWRNTGSRRVER